MRPVNMIKSVTITAGLCGSVSVVNVRKLKNLSAVQLNVQSKYIFIFSTTQKKHLPHKSAMITLFTCWIAKLHM